MHIHKNDIAFSPDIRLQVKIQSVTKEDNVCFQYKQFMKARNFNLVISHFCR